MKSARTKALDITKKVKDKVWERDEERCIRCGNHSAMPNAHYIPRSKGGLGIEENVVTFCIKCHYEYDETSAREGIGKFIERYLKKHYPDWNKDKLVYRKRD